MRIVTGLKVDHIILGKRMKMQTYKLGFVIDLIREVYLISDRNRL